MLSHVDLNQVGVASLVTSGALPLLRVLQPAGVELKLEARTHDVDLVLAQGLHVCPVVDGLQMDPKW